MTEEGSHGHARRNVLRVQFTGIDKAPVLQAMVNRVPPHLMAAARALLVSWQVEAPIVADEPAIVSYRGCGTMFRYSGSWSRVTDAEASSLLAAGASRIDDVCRLLQQNSEVQALWDEFQRFVEHLRRQVQLNRVTLACELHTAVSLEAKAPSIHFHLMLDSRNLAQRHFTTFSVLAHTIDLSLRVRSSNLATAVRTDGGAGQAKSPFPWCHPAPIRGMQTGSWKGLPQSV